MDANNATFVQNMFVNVRSLNVNNEPTTSSVKYRERYATITDLAYTNLIASDINWNAIPEFSQHKEISLKLTGQFDLSILDNAIKMKLHGTLCL